METLKLENLKVEKIELKSPPLEELAEALSKGLATEYEEVAVNVVDCPNLTLAPFNLAAEGLGGDPSVVQVGDAAYVVPNTLKEKLYDFRDVPKALQLESAFIIGAGGGCWPACGHFCEMCANVTVNGNDVRNFTKEVYTEDKTLEGLTVASENVNESRFSVLGSLYVCRGKPGKVVRVSCKRRKDGNGDFAACINSSMKKAFSYPVAVGAVIQMIRGKAIHHVCPSFCKGIPDTTKMMKEFLLLPEVSAPYTSVGTLLTFNPPGWRVQLQHFHSFNERNEGGHYHHDVTPEDVDYLAYVAPATTLCSIDQPDQSIDIFNYKCPDA